MTDPNLIAQWEAIKLHLKAARACVPENEDTQLFLHEFDNYFDNNELGLAHGVLEEMGLQVLDLFPEFKEKRTEFWNSSCAAASMMSK